MTAFRTGTTEMKIRDMDYEKLHDADPVTYHATLARFHVSCGFCEYKDKKREAQK